MSSALTFLVLGYTNLLGSQLSLTNTGISPGTIVHLVQGPDPVIRADYTYTSGIGAHKLVTREYSWNTARRYCEQEGAHLAVINSVAEAQAILRLLESSDVEGAWIGVHDQFAEGEYVTIHDETLGQTGFTSWSPGEPNNASDEDCLELGRQATMNDVRCNRNRAAICEMPVIQAYVVRQT